MAEGIARFTLSEVLSVRHSRWQSMMIGYTKIHLNFSLPQLFVNDSVTREAITRKQERAFLNYVRESGCYKKYYDAIYILFKTGLRISEFVGLTLSDIDLEHRKINVGPPATTDNGYAVCDRGTQDQLW